MKVFQFQKASKKFLPYVFLMGLLLVFVAGTPLTGEDLSFSKKLGQGNLFSWIPVGTAMGGNYLSVLFTGMMIKVSVLRHVLMAVALGGTMIALISYCGFERPYMYMVLTLLALCAPTGIFAYSFGNTVGAGMMLVPAFLLVLYLFTVYDLFRFKGRKKVWKIPFLFLSGVACQLFCESIGVTMLLISLFFFIVLSKKHGFSMHLAAHFFGCVLGLGFSLMVPGSVDRISGDFYTFVDRLSFALDQLFISNLAVMGVMTLAALLLIQPVRSERSRNCNLTLGFLLIPFAFFVLLYVLKPAMEAYVYIGRFVTVAKLIAAIAYTYGIYRMLQHYVSKHEVLIRLQNSIVSVWIFILVYPFVGTALPSMLYIPFALLAGATALLLYYAFRHYEALRKAIRTPLFFAGIVGILALSVMTISNYGYSMAVDTHIQDCLSENITEITLPQAPYEDRLVKTEFAQLSDYYDFPAYGEVKIFYVPFGQWDWETFYEIHNVPVVEEYEKKAPGIEDIPEPFQED